MTGLVMRRDCLLRRRCPCALASTKQAASKISTITTTTFERESKRISNPLLFSTAKSSYINKDAPKPHTRCPSALHAPRRDEFPQEQMLKKSGVWSQKKKSFLPLTPDSRLFLHPA